MTELLALITVATTLAESLSRIHTLVATCMAENRDPTPAEMAAIHSRQFEAESKWAALAPKSR